MNKLKYSLLCKAIVFTFLVFFAFCTLFTLIGTGVCFRENFYIQNQQKIEDNFYFEASERIASEVRDCVYFFEDGSMHLNKKIIDYEKIVSIADFAVRNNKNDKIVFKSSENFNNNYLSINNYRYIGNIKITVYFKPFKDENIFSFKYNMLIGIYKNRFLLLINTVICFAITALLFSFLIFSAGYKKGIKNIKATFLEKLPFDVFTLFTACGVGVSGVFALELFDNLFSFLNYSLNFEPIFVYLLGVILLLFACGSLFVIWSMSLAKRIRLKATIKNCLITKIG